MKVYIWRCSMCGGTAVVDQKQHTRFIETLPEMLRCAAVTVSMGGGPEECRGVYQPFVHFDAEPVK